MLSLLLLYNTAIHRHRQTGMSSQASQFSQDDRRSVLKKKDVIRGLRRTEGTHISQCEHSAPPFAVAFAMVDKTTLPELARKAIWAINNAYACVEKGEEGAYIKGIHGLICLMGSRKGTSGKTTIQRDDTEKTVLKEMNIQMRIHVVESGSIVEHYAVLLVSSPIAFSMRKAVWNTLHTRGRGLDGVDADMRRVCWNRLATHVRQGFVPCALNHHRFDFAEEEASSSMAGMYTRNEMAQAYDTGVDWLRVSNAESFTCLFNVHRAVEWVSKHFFAKYPQVDEMRMEGFGLMNRGGEFVSPRFISQCAKYDDDVDKGIAKTYKKKQNKKKRKTNTANIEGESDEAAEDDDDDDENAQVRVDVPEAFQGEVLDEDSDQRPEPGYPRCAICMDVHMPKTIENFPSFEAFWSDCRGFPTSVTLDILKKSLRLELSEPSDDDDADQLLTLIESDMLVKGDNPILKRPMLSGGDIFWGKQCKLSMLLIPANEAARRLEYQRKIVRLAYVLGLTRAAGSDVYDNKRVEAYGKHMAMGLDSRRECAEASEAFMAARGGRRMGCCVYEAMFMFTNVFFECNLHSWHLRPDNLYLVMQMMISDVMLCLNYHDSMIGGACNGIGATLIVRDGSGNYRTFCRKDTNVENAASPVLSMGQIYSKKNGSGADMCVSIYKSQVNMSAYNSKCGMNVEGFSELKRTTELGLLQDCCNVIENPNTPSQKQTHTVKDTCSRRYSTELKAGNDAQSQSCMQSISWLVVRNTTGLDSNCYATTKENEKTKTRVAVEYRQVTFGFWVICTNAVGQASRERFKTILTVTRSMPSATNGITQPGERPDAADDDNGVRDTCMRVNDTQDTRGAKAARPLFFGNMCTAIVSSFLQWTGVLGKLPASPVLEAIIEVFYVQLGKSKDMLNPDMYNPGERGRCLQISKARGVAMSLIMTSMEQTMEAGRRKQGKQDAVEGTALRLMLESTSPHMASWIIADTMEHMFRTDLLILMQMLGIKLEVPNSISLEDVLQWLRTGNTQHCAALHDWLSKHERLALAPLDRRSGGTEIAKCVYLTHGDLACNVGNQGQVDMMTCHAVGSGLFFQNAKILSETCQIHGSHAGEEIVQCMVLQNANQSMTWPSVFGTFSTLPHFWLDNGPADVDLRESLSLMPLRVVITEARKASLCVDARWLLLYCSLCGTVPSQSSRFTGISKWVEYFYRTCVPDRMVCNPWLFTGLPSPIMNCGLMIAPHVPSGRKTLRRPRTSGYESDVGLNAPIRSRAVEDLGPAALRYQMAEMLQVCERSLPTECVSYSFPVSQWCPVLLPEGFASLKCDAEGDFWLKTGRAAPETNVTAASGAEDSFLSGRITVDARPLCVFDRGGVAVMLRAGVVGVLLGYDHNECGYRAGVDAATTLVLDPYETEDAIIPVEGEVLLSMQAFPLREQYSFSGPGVHAVRGDAAPDNGFLLCRLAIFPWIAGAESGGSRKLCVSVSVDHCRGLAVYGSSHGGVQLGRKRMDLEVDVTHVRAPNLAGAVIFEKVKREHFA